MTDRQHGTRARYVMGPGEHDQPGKACRCKPCTDANREWSATRERQILYGRWQPFTDAGPAREHLHLLREHGIGRRQAAKLSGVSQSVLCAILNGHRGGPPRSRIRPETAAAILAVRLSPAALGDAALVDATGTHRRIQALACNGWSLARICERLGMLRSNFGALMERAQVTAATAQAVQVLYDELWDQPPPESAHHEKIAASRARNYARARGWLPPAAFDDDTIDDPQATPEDCRRRGRLGSAELAEEWAKLEAQGLDRVQAAERLGVSRAALDKALERTRKAAA